MQLVTFSRASAAGCRARQGMREGAIRGKIGEKPQATWQSLAFVTHARAVARENTQDAASSCHSVASHFPAWQF
jgi:hypothetical protein